MNKKLITQSSVLFLFISVSLCIYFIGRWITGIIYKAHRSNNLFEQISDALTISRQFHGVFVFTVLFLSLIGFAWSKKNNKAYSVGFFMCVCLSIVLVVVYFLMFF